MAGRATLELGDDPGIGGHPRHHQVDGPVRASPEFARLAQPFMGHPRQVARVIGRAVSTRVPRARYLVGPDARILALIEQMTPTLVKDTVIRLGLGL